MDYSLVMGVDAIKPELVVGIVGTHHRITAAFTPDSS